MDYGQKTMLNHSNQHVWGAKNVIKPFDSVFMFSLAGELWPLLAYLPTL